MGAGVAKQIKNNYPKAFRKYKEKCDSSNPNELLGKIQLVKVNSGRYIANLFTQVNYGSMHKSFNYNKLNWALEVLKHEVLNQNIDNKVALPKIGCGYGKADFNRVKSVIENVEAGFWEFEFIIYIL